MQASVGSASYDSPVCDDRGGLLAERFAVDAQGTCLASVRSSSCSPIPCLLDDFRCLVSADTCRACALRSCARARNFKLEPASHLKEANFHEVGELALRSP